MKKKLIIGVLSIIMGLMFGSTLNCQAQIAGDDAFSNLVWEQVHEETVLGPQGVVQSVCATEYYIIAIENISDAAEEPDVVSAYYRKDVDEYGNAVVPYSLAKRTSDTNWEHGNGMTYNPNTNEIYVAPYTHANPANRGCILVMDPDTLAYKRTIKLTDSYNVLGIGYREESDQYVIQTDVDGQYSFKILDANFQVIEELGAYAHTAKGDNFQDLEVSGDYILNFPLTLGLGLGDFLHVYSISRRSMVADSKLDFQFTNVVLDEPESLCELEPGVFLTAVNVVEDTGARKVRFYKTVVPYYFSVAVTAEHGSATVESKEVLRGGRLLVSLEAQSGYQLASVKVNGQEMQVSKQDKSVMVENIQENKVIDVVYTPVPVEKKEVYGIQQWIQSVPMTIIAAVAVVFTAAVWLLGYIIHVRRERKRRALRMKRKRDALRSAPVQLR